MEFSYSQTENFEMEKLSSGTGNFKKTVEINRVSVLTNVENFRLSLYALLFMTIFCNFFVHDYIKELFGYP